MIDFTTSKFFHFLPFNSLQNQTEARFRKVIIIYNNNTKWCFKRLLRLMAWGLPQDEAMQISLEVIASIEDNWGLSLTWSRLIALRLKPRGYWGLSLKYSKGFNGFRAFIDFLYTFVKRFKPQHLLVVVTYAFMGFSYRFISFVLHPMLGLKLLKNKGLVDYQLTL